MEGEVDEVFVGVLEAGTRAIHLVEEGEPRATGGEFLERVEIVAGERIGCGERIGGEREVLERWS